MTTDISAFVEVLRQHRLLDSKQLEELSHRPSSDPKSLAKELIQRSWITPYQANQLLQGKAAQLTLGQYVLLERLGEGGMGEVFKARHRTLNRISALKLIRKERVGSLDAVKRFYREVRAAAQLDHPNIVHAFDANEIDGTHILVMEYVEGTDLSKLVKKNGALPVQEACEYIRQAALGLQHAFEKGMVHRDIKPHNLLLSSDERMVKILDMGLARLESADDDDKSSTALTKEGMILGTPDYIAPEQAMETHAADIRSDIYSLGCTFYYLLSGRVPFPSTSFTEKLLGHQFDEPTPVRQLCASLPENVEAVVQKMMAKKPEDRFQTPAQVVAALSGKEVWPTDTGITKRPSSIPGHYAEETLAPLSITRGDSAKALGKPPARPATRRSVAITLASGMIVLLVIAVWFFFGKDRADHPPAKQPTIVIESPPPPKPEWINLLALIKPDSHAVKGKWHYERSAVLVSDSSSPAVLRILYSLAPGDEYSLRLVAKRVQGVDSLCISLPVGQTQTMAIIDSFPPQGYWSAFELLDGKRGDINDTRLKGPQFVNGKPMEIECRVRMNHVTMKLDGRTAVEWKGDSKRLAPNPTWSVPDKKAMFLATWASVFQISKLEIKLERR